MLRRQYEGCRSPLVLGPLLLCVAHAGAACTDADKGFMFSECRLSPTTGDPEAKAVEYWNTPCDETAGAATLRPPATVKCTHCLDGEYQHYDTVTQQLRCEKCAPGTFAVSETKRYEEFTDGEMPDGMSSYCHQDWHQCSPWRVEDGVLTSGPNNNPTLQTHLVLIIDVQKNLGGVVNIEYRLECQQDAASFMIFLDDEPIVKKMTGLAYSWENVGFYATRGHHIIRFSYLKNKAEAVGKDRAYIKSITVSGQLASTNECTACPPGTQAPDAGSKECTPCPAGSKRAKEDDAAQCIACDPDFETSSPGSSECLELEPCLFPAYKECKPSATHPDKVERQENWVQKGCIVPTDQFGKEEGVTDCAECPVGFYRDTSSALCVRCEKGFLDPETKTCKACPLGHFPERNIILQTFDAFEGRPPQEGFAFDSRVVTTNTCTGMCRAPIDGNDAWEIRKLGQQSGGVGLRERSVLSSGTAHGSKVRSVFSVKVKMSVDGWFKFGYTFMGQTSCVRGQFEVEEDKRDAEAISYDLDRNHHALGLSPVGRLDSQGNVTLSQGKAYTLRWIFAGYCGHTDSSHMSSLNVIDLEIHGVHGAGAAGCIECPKGHACPADAREPVPCTEGLYQHNTGSEDCLRCPEGTVSKTKGQEACIPCGTAAANEQRSQCVAVCKFRDPDSEKGYDLGGVGRMLLGPIVDSANLAFRKQYENAPENLDVYNQTAADQYNIHRYYMKLCEIVNDDEDEHELCPSDKNSYVCQRLNSERAYSLGDWPEYKVLPNGTGINVTFSHGSVCKHHEGGPYPRTTHLAMHCDPSAVDIDAQALTFVREDSCDYFFSLRSARACPLCEDSDFLPVEGACDTTTLTAAVLFYKREGSRCVGTKEPSTKHCTPKCVDEDWKPTYEPCTPDGTEKLVWMIRDGVNCTASSTGPVDEHGNVYPLPGSDRSCVGTQRLGMVIIVIACVVILLCLCLVQVYRKKRLMEHKYAALASDRDHPMQAFPDVDGVNDSVATPDDLEPAVVPIDSD